VVFPLVRQEAFNSLRERFGVEKKYVHALPLIREALEEKFIRLFSEDAPPKLMKYVPSWA
jgi:hypothetical protein